MYLKFIDVDTISEKFINVDQIVSVEFDTEYYDNNLVSIPYDIAVVSMSNGDVYKIDKLTITNLVSEGIKKFMQTINTFAYSKLKELVGKTDEER